MNGAQIVQVAKEQLTMLTGLKPDTVSGLRRDDHGWHVTIDMIEMKRVPDSGDVLAIYEVSLDDKGDLLAYRRTRRYHRGQVEKEL